MSQSGAILWEYEIDGQLWAPLNYEGGNLFFGSDDSNFYAFDVAEQAIKWTFKTGGRIRSGADITNGLVVFASDDGFLYALDAETGVVRWRCDLGSSELTRRLPAPGPPYSYDYLHSSPRFFDGHIYIGSADHNLYAIDHQSGEVEWRFSSGGPIRSTPHVDSERVYVGSWDGNLYSLDRATGKQVWKFETQGLIQGSPATGIGKVYVGSRSAKVYAVDASTGEGSWEYVHADGSWVESSPVVDDGDVFIDSSDALKLSAFDADTGDVKWEFTTGGWSWGKPVVENGVVYICSLSAYPYYVEGVDLVNGLFAVDQQTGLVRWSIETGTIEGYITGGVFSTPVINEGVVYVAGIDGRLLAIRE